MVVLHWCVTLTKRTTQRTDLISTFIGKTAVNYSLPGVNGQYQTIHESQSTTIANITLNTPAHTHTQT